MTKRPERKDVMLAYPAEPGRIQRLGPRFFIQPKFNGERARTEWYMDEPVLISSFGNAFRGLDHITKAIQDHIPESLKLDGEIYLHGWPFNKIHSAASRKVNESEDAGHLQYHIFDIQDQEADQTDRVCRIMQLRQQIPPDSPIKVADTFLADKHNWLHFLQTFVEDGYEGIMLRSPMGTYTLKRNVQLLKFKPTEVDYYLILGVEEAISLDGIPKAMVGAFWVQGKEGGRFKVGAGKLSHKARSFLWQYREPLPGKYLKVKHELLRTKNDVPVASVAVEIVETNPEGDL